MMYEDLEENKSVIRDMLGNYITRSEIIDFYCSIQECDIGKETFVRYLMGIIGGCRENEMC